MNTWSPDVYAKAWYFATIAHEGQTYGGRTEGERINYLNHIGSVAMEVIHAIQQTPTTLQADLAIQCALLHDVIEDTAFGYDDIVQQFGTAVADGVLALTKDKRLPSKTDQMLDSLRRIQEQPYEVWIVKMADRITNLSHPPYYWDGKKIVSYQEEAELILQELRDGNALIAARLRDKIMNYTSFAKPPQR
ncbi:MAG: bifunctional (p)ppGpp synthetase/guanosine-3*,5*-bis(diphosphate) 3*-pyrophosphohydrolase [Chloroflexi bacterium AL-W]|nr:bifunctional (p)ppGpp synthetase/guanosine-3*,5*-bis(diphosphate) 3*-pyrophosphohydrolase [Chloroflexi bacterium AL-N1]NOK66461.1 bifunctional (p)ppGpp synthetase/guanosine-3*,5*-bis(diphosphate) 3*-pyrophosphohydrolase [Chloroflexi bacterium AL-N10]NOK71849.1 bifunctional (p)ppGpp synthetase/guanosine-3*,5*-bis(diphosphate) 3*-pyrophosphohydrolase [Chloroflexi bacterium AL-N5]NOK81106.1 bifunctional (p)ppGpp synthetase/guanosine-3*,5*-bis(diphosphate) 3*-pyrophosphohydrolase [Chloroflexi bac